MNHLSGVLFETNHSTRHQFIVIHFLASAFHCHSCLRTNPQLHSDRNSSTFSLNNQPDTLIIPILFCYKTLHISGIFSAHHQEISTLHSALVSFMQVSDDRFQAESGWNILTLPNYINITRSVLEIFKMAG